MINEKEREKKEPCKRAFVVLNLSRKKKKEILVDRYPRKFEYEKGRETSV